jgi:hypothetical protein
MHVVGARVQTGSNTPSLRMLCYFQGCYRYLQWFSWAGLVLLLAIQIFSAVWAQRAVSGNGVFSSNLCMVCSPWLQNPTVLLRASTFVAQWFRTSPVVIQVHSSWEMCDQRPNRIAPKRQRWPRCYSHAPSDAEASRGPSPP